MKRVENNMVRNLSDDPKFNEPLKEALKCPNCDVELEYTTFGDDPLAPEALSCPKCRDAVYDIDTGEKIGDLT